MKVLEETQIIREEYMCDFEEQLKKYVNDYLERGLMVDVKFSPCGYGNDMYCALVLGYREDIQ